MDIGCQSGATWEVNVSRHMVLLPPDNYTNQGVDVPVGIADDIQNTTIHIWLTPISTRSTGQVTAEFRFSHDTTLDLLYEFVSSNNYC